MTLEILIIIALILANGLFAMAEIAIVSARKARLKQLANEGHKKAEIALHLADNPDDLLSTVQVGITLIGILAGAFGGATIAGRLTPLIAAWPPLAPYADSVALTTVVIGITYLSLIIGELAPKRIALDRPERIASSLAPLMRALSKAAHPVVRFLTWSTDAVVAILPIKQSSELPVTEEEIKVLVEQGTKAGAFEEAEQELIEGVFRLADRRASELMTPRHEIAWADLAAPAETLRRAFAESPHSRLPVGEGSLDKIVGIVYVKDLFAHGSDAASIDLAKLLHKPLFIPEAARAMRVLEKFQTSGTHFGVVIDEHGGVEGVLTLTDLFQAIVGHLPTEDEPACRPPYFRRQDGSWLVEGGLPVAELKELIPIGPLPEEDEHTYTTIGGLIMTVLEKIPQPGDFIQMGAWRFEVVDMDGNRVDEVLISGPGHGLNLNTPPQDAG